MKLKTVPARQGVLWVQAGFRVFFRQPLLFGALFTAVAFAALLLLQLPLVGPLLALALMPTASLGFMFATRAVLGGQALQPAQLLAPLRDPLHRRRLLALGFVYATAALAVMLVVQQLDGGRFDAALQALSDGTATPESLQEAGLATGLLLRLASIALLSLVFWHTPALVVWGEMGVAKAVFASVLACLRSLGAFTLLGLTWFAVSLLFAVLAQTLFGLLGRPESASLAMLPGGLMFSTVFYASLYFTFVDSFDLEDAPPTALA